MEPQALRSLLSLLSIPTAPFREALVRDWAARLLDAASVPCCEDPHGNLIVGAASPADYRKRLRENSADPVRLFVAHMDHPGFHGLRWLDGRILLVRWHGGAPLKRLRGAMMWLADANGMVGHGRIRRAQLDAAGRCMETLEITVEEGVQTRARALFGGFAFRRPVWHSGRRVYTKAADDLVGVFAILMTALRLKRRRRPAPFLGLLTRAEEVGFVGMLAHLELGWLQAARRPPLCISLEASRTLPGARIGHGPVVRLGDRRTVFDAAATEILSALAARVLPGRHQRRIMDGGACEASAITAHGLPAIGLSVPLGNYHNQSLEGGPDSTGRDGPAPEFVHLDDVAGLLSLCHALVTRPLPWARPWDATQARLQRRLRRYRPLLDMG
jgi:endoglucanase